MVVSTLSVLGKGTYYQLYINDQLIDVFLDDSIADGLAGIGTVTCQFLERAGFTFDNFEIRTSDPVLSTSPTALQDTNPRLIFSETFDNNDNGWNTEPSSDDEFTSSREVRDGKYYRISETNANSDGYWGTNSIPDVTRKNFCLMFDAQVNEYSGNGAIVIVVRANNYSDEVNDSYYYIGLNWDGGGTVYLDLAGAGNSRKVATLDTGFPWIDKKLHTVKLSFQDGNLEIYDGQTNALLESMTFSDEELFAGEGAIRLGVELFGPDQKINVGFDNVLVYDKCP
jgi:hypothetical protein